MAGTSITVRVDDRVRALATLLALTTWPEQEQAFKPHGVHPYAKSIRVALGQAAHARLEKVNEDRVGQVGARGWVPVEGDVEDAG